MSARPKKYNISFHTFILCNTSFALTEIGIVFTPTVYPICLPLESNENPYRWKNEEVEVLGFASVANKVGPLKVAKMSVFTQDECNKNLDEKKKCKWKGAQVEVIFKKNQHLSAVEQFL